MKLLLDTHVLLWWLDDPLRISEEARDQISNPDNEVLVSAASCWEIEIKRSLKRLTAPEEIDDGIGQCGFGDLAISIVHSIKAGALPLHHRDPFDGMLIAQSICESAFMVTHDQMFELYGVPLIPA